jgi:hypothetical protein
MPLVNGPLAQHNIETRRNRDGNAHGGQRAGQIAKHGKADGGGEGDF